MIQKAPTNLDHASDAQSPPVTDQLAALAEADRLRILRLLEREELSVGELAKVLQLPQSTLSRRLKLLADAGWVERRAEGAASLYLLAVDTLPELMRQLWHAVRAQMTGDEIERQLQADSLRLASVLAERRANSQTYFGRIAGEWDVIRRELFGSGFTARALLALLPSHWIVADLGCGTGNAAEHLAPFVKRVVAVDFSEPMLEAAQKRLAAFDNIDFVQGDLAALPLEDESVNAAVCVLVLHHLDNPIQALREMARVLKPGGKGLLIEMQAHDRREYRTTMGHKHLGFTDDAISELLREAGFQNPQLTVVSGAPDAKGPNLLLVMAERAEKDQQR